LYNYQSFSIQDWWRIKTTNMLKKTEKAQQSNRSVSGRRVIDETCSGGTDGHKRGAVNRKKVS